MPLTIISLRDTCLCVRVCIYRGGSSSHFTQMIWGETTAIGCGVLAREMYMDGKKIIRVRTCTEHRVIETVLSPLEKRVVLVSQIINFSSNYMLLLQIILSVYSVQIYTLQTS